MPRSFYRIVHSARPSVADFASAEALGSQPPNDEPETLRLWGGISVYDTLSRAAAKSRRYPWLGAFVAKLDVPDEADVRAERTTKSRGHHTVWAAPEFLLSLLVEVTAER